ncbi:MAG: hypothetical protein QOD95_1536 [Gammaproteobacteria bacterium]|nr:hypothetical protein [Gammaproteobacteria bacterium]
MRGVLSLATFAIGVLCFAFVTNVRSVRKVHIFATPSPSEQGRVQ